MEGIIMDDKINLLEEIMELQEGVLTPDSVLSDYPEWDSISILSFVATVEEQTGKIITTDDIKSVKTVRDALRFLE